MIKQLLILVTIALIMNNCTIKAQSEKRKELINKVITAIKKHDTAQLYNLIDTNYVFNLETKEGFLFKVNYVYNKFKLCDTVVGDIKKREKLTHFIEYTLPFCRDAKGEIIYDSFDLLLTFSDFDNDRKINFIDIVIYREDSEPIKAPPSK